MKIDRLSNEKNYARVKKSRTQKHSLKNPGQKQDSRKARSRRRKTKKTRKTHFAVTGTLPD